MHLVMRGAWFKSTQCRPCSYRVIKRISCPRSCPARRQARHNRHDLYEFSQWEGSSRPAAGAHAGYGPYKYECLADHRQLSNISAEATQQALDAQNHDRGTRDAEGMRQSLRLLLRLPLDKPLDSFFSFSSLLTLRLALGCRS